VGRYISEFQHILQGIYTRTARIIYPAEYMLKPTHLRSPRQPDITTNTISRLGAVELAVCRLCL